MIGGIRPVGYGFTFYQPYSPLQNAQSNMGVGTSDAITGVSGKDSSTPGIDDPLSKAVGKTECQTCKERKYVDGSDEMVSFKSPSKISPESAAGKVMAHEQEHVANAFGKAAEKNGTVLQASVQLKTAICPECGRSYVAGGTTTTKIAYPKDNPYGKNRKSADRDALVGANVDLAV